MAAKHVGTEVPSCVIQNGACPAPPPEDCRCQAAHSLSSPSSTIHQASIMRSSLVCAHLSNCCSQSVRERPCSERSIAELFVTPITRTSMSISFFRPCNHKTLGESRGLLESQHHMAAWSWQADDTVTQNEGGWCDPARSLWQDQGCQVGGVQTTPQCQYS